MSVLFDSTRPVKANRPFGADVLAPEDDGAPTPTPFAPRPYRAIDAAEWARISNRDRRDYDALVLPPLSGGAPEPAESWPSWCDDDTWELGPEPDLADVARLAELSATLIRLERALADDGRDRVGGFGHPACEA
jgi:hypothetical protein